MKDSKKICSGCGKPLETRRAIGFTGSVLICEDCLRAGLNIIDRLNKTEAAKSSAKIENVKMLKKPREIVDFLDGYVIGQDRAKRSLAVAVYNHYKRINGKGGSAGGSETEIEKSNILMIGPPGGGRKRPDGPNLTIDTSNILFICGGAFAGIEKMIGNDSKTESIGFGAAFGKRQEASPDEKRRIITEPKNSLARQYQKLMEIDGVKLEFEPDAVREIARIAMRKNTGARGLRVAAGSNDLWGQMPQLPPPPGQMTSGVK